MAQELERFRQGDALLARPPSRLGRILRWHSRSTDAVVFTAGGFAILASIILIIWELCGILLVLSGRVEAPGNATRELAMLAFVFHPLLLFAGIATINKNMWGLLLGTAISCTWVIMLALAALNAQFGVLQLDILSGSVDTPFYRYQVIVLFLIVACLGAIVHLLALTATLRKSSV